MTVTKDQAQMLTTLAIACRPHRAPTWDEAGTYAAIGKVKDRALAEVILAVIRAAADREAASPGVIPSNGSHWQEQLKPGLFVPTNKRDDDKRCCECGLLEPQCRDRQRINGEHPFVSIAANRAATARPSEAVARIVADLKETTTPPASAGENERVARAAQMEATA